MDRYEPTSIPLGDARTNGSTVWQRVVDSSFLQEMQTEQNSISPEARRKFLESPSDSGSRATRLTSYRANKTQNSRNPCGKCGPRGSKREEGGPIPPRAPQC